jgi:hypothetical protein
MTMDERWVNRTPQTMLDTFPWFHGEGFDLIVEDLLKLPPDRAIIVEGFRLLPGFVKPLLYRPNQGIWLIPAPEFRLAAFMSRGTLWGIAQKTNNPERALSNLLERDRLFTLRLQEMIEKAGVAAINVDGLMAESDLEDRVATQLDLR